MNESNTEPKIYANDEISLFKYWLMVKKRWRLVLIIFFIGIITAAVIYFTMTPVYQAKTSILPISTESSMLSIVTLPNMPITGGGESNAQKIMAVLNSITIKRNVIHSLNLLDVLFEEKPMKRDPVNIAVEKVGDMMGVSSDIRTGVITVSVRYKDPEIAKEIANQYIKELKLILRGKSLTVAKMNRIFIEERLKVEEEKLKMYQEQMADFQKETKIIEPSIQVKEAMELHANLIAQRIALEVELKKIEPALSEENPRVTALKSQLAALNNQIEKIEEETYKGALPSLKNVPDKLIEYSELLRMVENSTAIYERLSEMYEKAKLEEIQEGLYVEVIDPALIPDLPIKPNKRVIFGVAGLTSIIFGIIFAVILELYKVYTTSKREG